MQGVQFVVRFRYLLTDFINLERTIATNYLGPVQLVLALLPSMQARKQGHIVNISTWGVRMPPGARDGRLLSGIQRRI